MRKKSIRCYRVNADLVGEKNGTIFYTTPDFGDSPHLYSCLECGEIFVVDPERAYYSGKSVDTVIEDISCPGCSAKLSETLKPYPDSFLSVSGIIESFEPDKIIPPESESIIEEFWDIYSVLE